MARSFPSQLFQNALDEFGAVLPLVAVAVAFYFWTRRGEVEGVVNAGTERTTVAV
jgi:hypothetical protein